MANILGFDVPLNMPSFSFGGSWLWLIVSIFIFAFGGVIIIFVIYNLRLYKYKIIVFENIAGQGFQPTFKDRARLVKMGDGGEELFFLRKKKVYRTAYGRKMGPNTYWFTIAQDGYWYNSILGDFDAKRGMLDIEPIDRDMRYMNVAMRKNIEKRFNKQSFMDRYGTIVMSGIFLLIMIIGIWFLLSKVAEISAGVSGGVEASKQLQESNAVLMENSAKLIAHLDNIISGGGLVGG